MPRISDKLPINNPMLDRRVKVKPEDRENIKRLFFKEKMGIREIARIYERECSRRTIQFILFPERAKRVVELHDWRRYYTKESNAAYQRKHRQYKSQLYKAKLIVKKENDKTK